jgi:hypothetical protein
LHRNSVSLAWCIQPQRIGGGIDRLQKASFIFALLAGCSTVTVEQEAEQAKASWQGATYDEVVMRWGPPNRSATLSDGRQTHTWTSQEGPVRAGGPSVGVGVFGGGGGGGVGVGVGIPFGTTVNPPICERTVTFQEGRLVDQNWTGDPGYCRYFKRA